MLKKIHAENKADFVAATRKFVTTYVNKLNFLTRED